LIPQRFAEMARSLWITLLKDGPRLPGRPEKSRAWPQTGVFLLEGMSFKIKDLLTLADL
jgi:hypothetical protein